MFDVDNFNKVNEYHGEDIADEVLTALVTYLKNNLRDVDYLFRIGGDEFAILIPFTDYEQALQLANKLRLVYRNRNSIAWRVSRSVWGSSVQSARTR